MGLLLVLEYGLAASTVAVGWSGYVVSLLKDVGIHIPVALTAAPGVPVREGGEIVGYGVANVPAIIAIAGVTALLVRGVQESATANNIVVAIKLVVVIAFIAVGAFFVNADNWVPFVPEQVPPPPADAATGIWAELGRALMDIVTAENTSRYGIGGIITAAATIFFAYLGFEAVSTAGAEARNPSRDMPIGIIGSLLICTLLYILTSAVLVGIVPYTQLDSPAPIAIAVNAMGMPWFAVLVKIGAIAGISSVMLVLLYGQTRIFYTMSRDGLLPAAFSVVHKKFRTPWIDTLVVGFVASGFAGFMSLDNLAKLTNVGSLTAFAMVCLTVIYLRITAPELERPFRLRLFPLVPLLGAGMCVLLVMSLMAHAETRDFFLIYLGLGILVYFGYGIRNSKLGKGELVINPEPTMDLPKKLDV
jgi:APA family basic amino acid/polyamine antiporter